MHSTKGLVAIVEDDDSVRRSIERLLRANDYATAAFASAEEFLQSDVVDSAVGLVLDIHLGGMSGIELRRRLSAAEKCEVCQSCSSRRCTMTPHAQPRLRSAAWTIWKNPSNRIGSFGRSSEARCQ